jgi:ATP adenylyltransferase
VGAILDKGPSPAAVFPPLNRINISRIGKAISGERIGGYHYRFHGTDVMDTIFAPWRSDYIRRKKAAGCVLCRDSLRGEELVVSEGKLCYVMVNRYPYTSGHLMIVPYRHLGSLAELALEERAELFHFLDLAVRVLSESMNPEGFNIGMNLGKVAGAGIDDHLHMHVVPRWGGDTNFISVISGVRVIPEDVAGTAGQLRPNFEKLQREACG